MGIVEDIAQLKRQESTLQFASFNEDDAWALGTQMREKAIARAIPLAIHIQVAGRQLFYTALPGTTDENRDWIGRKLNGVMRYHKSSYRLGREHAHEGRPLDPGIAPGTIEIHGGSFPISLKGTGVVGTVTVSGVPQREDHSFVAECIADYLGIDYGPLALVGEH